uniref:Uncharacterized protein n=1 Tax=Glossina pallidipes TaxID=7398 RepID=A0A1A9ZU11_GLOPL
MSKRRSSVDQTYDIFCVNFHGTGLDSIKDEFKRQVQTGLRRTLFIIDLDDLRKEIKSRTKSSKGPRPSLNSPDLPVVQGIQQIVAGFRRQYDEITRKMSDELKFDIYEYWLRDLDERRKQLATSGGTKRAKKSVSTPTTSKTKVGKSFRKDRKGSLYDEPINCTPLIVRDHNRVGQETMASRLEYIIDDPTISKLYVVVIGEMNDEFGTYLVRNDLPLQAIIHFLPSESNYDILLGNNKRSKFIIETLEKISAQIYEQRKETLLKNIGILTHYLPVISTCMAIKYARDIFDQLSWGIYDIEVLYKQYQTYYVSPFQETDVSIPRNVSCEDLYLTAESLIVQGPYQRVAPPASDSDIATIIYYLDSLLGTCGETLDILTEPEIMFLAFTHKKKYPEEYASRTSLITNLKCAFVSVTKIKRFDRVFIDQNNNLLCSLLSYASQNKGFNLYLGCLDYSLYRSFAISGYILNNICSTPYSLEAIPLLLPKNVMLYTSEDSCSQRLIELLTEYDDYQVNDIRNGDRLYIFRRTYNTVFENEGLHVIPTCLCFRDFTIFQMEEFLRDLVDPMLKFNPSRSVASMDYATEMPMNLTDMNDDIFIRPKSLQFKMLQEEKKEREQERERERLREEETATINEQESPTSRGSRKSSVSDKRAYSTRDGSGNYFVGLPPNHHLIKGYNLEDIRQEIRVKTSKYYFRDGSVQLYEDGWCFAELNKQLVLEVNRSKVYFNRPRYLNEGISNSIRLITEHNICMRVLNESNEYAKIIMQYPNGLSIYYQNSYVDQTWIQESTYNNELKRLTTPYGCVIIFFKSQDMIMILRYNGEVYRLYQYVFTLEEEEELISQLTMIPSHESSGRRSTTDPKATQIIRQDDVLKQRRSSESKLRGKGKGKCTAEPKLREKIKPPRTRELKVLLENEINFVNRIATLYALSYLHLIITTAKGRVVNLAHNGSIYETTPLKLKEWHDYFINESYSERNDGVKMIWTREVLKCYHADGTVITTTTEESTVTEEDDEFDQLISQSSSHEGLEEEQRLSTHESSSSGALIEKYPQPLKKKQPKRRKGNSKTMRASEGIEEFEIIERTFVCFTCCSWLIQHAVYAGVYVFWPLSYPISSIEILGVDAIRFCIVKHFEDRTSYEEEGQMSIFTEESKGSYSRPSAEHDGEEEGFIGKENIVHLWIGDDLHLTISDTTCEMYVVLDREVSDWQILRDTLLLRIDFNDNITDVFKYFINAISQFVGAQDQDTKELYFLERTLADCTTKGFEFMECVPCAAEYSSSASNTTMQFDQFKSLDEMCSNEYDWFKADMKKFPRFTACRPESKEKMLPWILATKVFCKIPPPLRNTDEINKFIEPFEFINFKQLRRKMKRFLDENLCDEIRYKTKVLWSSKNWKRRYLEHQRRLFNEQQRIGLYHAMIKHKIYPKYFKFKDNYNYDVRYIDFFEFAIARCEGREVKSEEINFNEQKANKPIKPLRKHSKGRSSSKSPRSSKCKYGVYT